MRGRMQHWQGDMIRFMRDATEYSDYHSILANEIVNITGSEASILDAGCGTGALSVELAKKVAGVTSVDLSKDALNELRSSIARLDIHNISVICKDAFALEPKSKFDAAVFCYFGRGRDVLDAAPRLSSKKAIFIGEYSRKRRFASDRAERSPRRTIPEFIELLKRDSVDFSVKRLEMEFGQPFRSFDDAMLFFSLYNDAPPDPDAVKSRLVDIESGEYCLYCPLKKDIGIVSFDTAGLETRIGTKNDK